MSSCVVDTSALIAIAFAQAEADDLLQRIVQYEQRFIGVNSLLEAGIVFAGRKGSNHRNLINELLESLGVMPVALSVDMEARAWQAWLNYGKGRHPAALNYGDCMSYGVAAALNVPLLFVGMDFSQTDIAVA